jgi:hypothetical protein
LYKAAPVAGSRPGGCGAGAAKEAGGMLVLNEIRQNTKPERFLFRRLLQPD